MHLSELIFIKTQLNTTLSRINEQIDMVEKSAADPMHFLPGTKASEIRNTDGEYVMTPLLLAKAQTLNAMVHLLKE